MSQAADKRPGSGTAGIGIGARLRAAVATARPPVLVLLALYALLGLAQAGQPNGYVPLLKVLVVIAAFLTFSVACNDLADEQIDRVNLPGDPRRPLVTGAVTRGQMRTTAWIAAGTALAAGAVIGWPAAVITAAGLAVSGAYCVRPVRIAERGVLAPLLLPACYVAVPYLLGVTAGGRAPNAADLELLAGLYLGFIGRIVLKDFRDVRGDAMFGKRTFLVRHGRRWTCAFSACCWAAGTVAVLAALPDARDFGVTARGPIGLCALFAILLIAALAGHGDPRRDERLISAVAILGRGMIVSVIAYVSLLDLGRTLVIVFVLMNLLGALTLAQALSMVRHGPRRRVIPMPVDQRFEAADTSDLSAPGAVRASLESTV